MSGFGAFADVLDEPADNYDNEVEYEEKEQREKSRRYKEKESSKDYVRLPTCQYSPNCKRTNPEHFKKYYHPERESSPSKHHSAHKHHTSSGGSRLISTAKPSKHEDVSWLFPQKPCPMLMDGLYCRYLNIRYLGECKHAHPKNMVNPLKLHASYTLTAPNGAKLYDIKTKFDQTMLGKGAFVTAKRIVNKDLRTAFEKRQQYLIEKRGGTTLQDDLYHGCNDAIIPTICTTGFIVPSDYSASPNCPVSKHMVPNTSLCNSDCVHCTQQHKWNKCHMFGLGIYLANIAGKSASYVSGTPAGQTKKMLLCRVELGRSDIHQKIVKHDSNHDFIVPQKGFDSITVKGDPTAQAGPHKLSVVLDEYVVFHPFQVLPEYLIEYN